MTTSEFETFARLLKQNGCFVTKQRRQLFELLQQQPALSLKELIKLANQQDLVTVYRNVDLFEKLGIVTRLRLGWNTKIELSDMFKHHHHHFTCLKCSCIIDLPEDPTIENQIKRLTQQYKFNATHHSLEIRGYCKECIVHT